MLHDMLVSFNAARSFADLSPLTSIGLHKLKGSICGISAR